MQLFERQPYQFITQHSDKALKTLLQFKHRTFNATDLLYFIEFLKQHYTQHKSLETAFTQHGNTVEAMLTGFHNYFFRWQMHLKEPKNILQRLIKNLMLND